MLLFFIAPIRSVPDSAFLPRDSAKKRDAEFWPDCRRSQPIFACCPLEPTLRVILQDCTIGDEGLQHFVVCFRLCGIRWLVFCRTDDDSSADSSRERPFLDVCGACGVRRRDAGQTRGRERCLPLF